MFNPSIFALIGYWGGIMFNKNGIPFYQQFNRYIPGIIDMFAARCRLILPNMMIDLFTYQ